MREKKKKAEHYPYLTTLGLVMRERPSDSRTGYTSIGFNSINSFLLAITLSLSFFFCGNFSLSQFLECWRDGAGQSRLANCYTLGQELSLNLGLGLDNVPRNFNSK